MNFNASILKLRQQPRTTFVVIFGTLFVLFVALFFAIGALVVQRDLEQRITDTNAAAAELFSEMTQTMEALAAAPTVEPCSETFLLWLRRIALLPDGVHEIIYAEDGNILCSVTAGKLETPIQLDPPDYTAAIERDISVWFRRDLGMLGFPGVVGTFVSSGDFLLVVPELNLAAPMPNWTQYEMISMGADGSLWHTEGDYGLYAYVTGNTVGSHVNRIFQPGFAADGCDALYATCIAVLDPYGPLLQRFGSVILGGIAFAALLAGALTRLAQVALTGFWSLPSRFRRQLSLETTACQYQPLLCLQNDRICAIEVLARWRDDDDTLVPPYEFLPIVERRGLHRRFTQLVVDRAYMELRHLPAGAEPLRVHFNIFPCDFEPDWMLELFADFLAEKARFTVVIELVESDVLPIERTRNAIARLRENGILTFIDDFGEGYSSIGYLAGLGTYGVKLDRSFGQAPEGSLMDAMLSSAIEMVGKTGQVLVVEGVETASRLAALKETGKVAVAQGYFISRPVSFADLKSLLTQNDFWSNTEAA